MADAEQSHKKRRLRPPRPSTNLKRKVCLSLLLPASLRLR